MSLKKKIVWLPYDFDTAIGINNEGKLVFSYELEDTDHLEGGADVYNGQQSVIWNNIRAAFADELAEMYKTLRSTGALSYAKVEQMFEEHQAKWPERLANEDSKFKYTDPGVEDGNWSYLEMLQGLKTEQRKWWLYNRFRYIDSKYNAGDALSDLIQLRGYAKANVTVTPYADIYPSVKYGSYLVQERGHRGRATTLVCPLDNVNDTEIYIYSSSQLASVGDLAGLKVGFADFSMATRLQNIKIGDSSEEYENQNLTALTLGNNVLLKSLDVRNCPSLGTGDQKSVDLSGCEIIEEVYFDGTAIQGLTLPNGGVLKKLHVPATMTNLTILNQKAITEFVIPSYTNISTLRLENVSSVIDEKAILHAISATSRVRLIGINWECSGEEEINELLDLLDTMRGLDENGNNVETAQVSGRIHTEALTGDALSSFQERYPYITYDADYMETTLTLKTWDGSSTIAQITCYNGVPQVALPSIPARTSTAQYDYTGVGWNTAKDAQTNDADCVKNVMSNRTVYAAYSRTVRKYTVYFVRASEDGGGTLQTLYNIAYGTTLKASSYTAATPTTTKGNASDYPFEKWTPAFAPITGNTTYTAKFGSPVVVAEITDSWDTIIGNIDNGTYKTRYQIGNYKPIDLGTDGTINMQIAAFDADVDESGSKIPVTFIAMELTNNTYSLTNGNTYVFDWSNSDGRKALNTEVLNRIPANVRGRIITAQKTYAIPGTNNANGNRVTQTCYDKVWVPSGREANLNSYNETSGVIYDVLFKSAENRIRTFGGSAVIWATRTALWMNYSKRQMGVGSDGKLYPTSSGVNGKNIHLCIGFCLGTVYQAKYTGVSLGTAVEDSNFKSTYSVGDIFDLDLGTEGNVCAQLIAYDYDEKSDGTGKAAATFLTWYAMNNKYAVGGSNYPTSTLHDTLNTTIKAKMPTAVSSRIVEVNKVWNATGLTGGNTEYADSVWLVGQEKTLSNSINGSYAKTTRGGTSAYSCVSRDIYANQYYSTLYGAAYVKNDAEAYIIFGFSIDL